MISVVSLSLSHTTIWLSKENERRDVLVGFVDTVSHATICEIAQQSSAIFPCEVKLGLRRLLISTIYLIYSSKQLSCTHSHIPMPTKQG